MQMAIDPVPPRTTARKPGQPGVGAEHTPRAETPDDTPAEGRGASATDVDPGLNSLLTRMREANAHLIVAALRAQTLSEEAETASHLKDEFLAMASHEIRTPLSAVVGWARILESKELPPEDAERAIAAIGRNAAVSPTWLTIFWIRHACSTAPFGWTSALSISRSSCGRPSMPFARWRRPGTSEWRSTMFPPRQP